MPRSARKASTPSRRPPLDVEALWALARIGTPTLSPDGALACAAVTRFDMEGNDSRTELWLFPTGRGAAATNRRGAARPRRRTATLAPRFDQATTHVAWTPDSAGLLFTSEGRGRQGLWRLPRGRRRRGLPRGAEPRPARPSRAGRGPRDHRPRLARRGGPGLAHLPAGLRPEAQVAAAALGARRAAHRASRWLAPLWNAHVFAGRGYVVAGVNYHGSSGFGRRSLESITGDYGRREHADIEAATDHLLRRGYIDRTRLVASGGSYGGYLVAYMNGRTDRYRAYVCHAGCCDWVSMMACDDYLGLGAELGSFHWDSPARVMRQSPHRYVGRARTPTLVIHGELDYRVPATQALQYYDSLKAKGVAARLVHFPDENHWILKPQNSRLWYREFFAWVERYAPARRSGASRAAGEGPRVGGDRRRARVDAGDRHSVHRQTSSYKEVASRGRLRRS